jgi:hypothetical protein
LKPGGWYEQAEISVVPPSEDDSLRGTALEMWGPLALEGGDKFGKSCQIAKDTKELMEAAGFLNITYRTFKWPKDPKLKEIGAYNRLGWEEGMEGWAMFLFTKYHGVSCHSSLLNPVLQKICLMANRRGSGSVC